ncbi:MAG: hypothetical protein GXN96_01010 [Aquificae bacterium]|nr:hypothetical protein [Aquificota bacterium]
MELWVKINGEKKKYQGSFRSVMESLVKEGKGKEVQILCMHAPPRERRRWKRELRWYDKDVLRTASAIATWFYTREYRRLRRRIKELKKRARYLSKGEIMYNQRMMKVVEELQNRLSEIEKKIQELRV